MYLSQFDLVAEHWAKEDTTKRSNLSSLAQRVREKGASRMASQFVSDCSRLRWMRYFLSRLTPHLTFLIFHLLMVIAHSAGFKGQIHKKRLYLHQLSPSVGTWFQAVLWAKVTSTWPSLGAHTEMPTLQMISCSLRFWWRWSFFLEMVTVNFNI